MYEKSDKTLFQKIFRDITQGFSKTCYEGKPIFIKHLKPEDYILINEKENEILNKAIKRGLKTEKEALDDAIKDDLWTKEDEDFIFQQEHFLDNLRKTASQLLLKSEREKHAILIKEEQEKLNKKLLQKQSLTQHTAEQYAKNKINDFFLTFVFFKNQTLKDVFFSESDFYDLNYSEVLKLIKINNNFSSVFSELNIQKLILEEFFFPYMMLCEKPLDIFGKAAVELTTLQMSICTYCKIFKNIFDNNPKIPESIKKDPEALLEYVNSESTKSKENLDKHLSKEGATTVFGADREDYRHLGVEDQDIKSNISLTEAAKKKGGTLTMQDLMELQGKGS